MGVTELSTWRRYIQNTQELYFAISAICISAHRLGAIEFVDMAILKNC